jgi:hypothetical protein
MGIQGVQIASSVQIAFTDSHASGDRIIVPTPKESQRLARRRFIANLSQEFQSQKRRPDLIQETREVGQSVTGIGIYWLWWLRLL